MLPARRRAGSKGVESGLRDTGKRPQASSDVQNVPGILSNSKNHIEFSNSEIISNSRMRGLVASCNPLQIFVREASVQVQKETLAKTQMFLEPIS